ncbi:glycosyltransferase family 4 protein [Parolsenella catena]|uniref:glycosyltransferase family 4 protein n=1 Tax=Parolsenella catena TaxID=2003188 RepID=UPI003F97B8DC
MSRGSTKKIGLIGRINPECRLFDGQTVKTRMMYRLLCETYGEDSIYTVDTYDYKHRAPVVMADFARCLAKCEKLVVLLSANGRRVFFPLLSFASKHMGKKIYHNLIGGALACDLEKYPKWVKYLNSFEINWVESHALVQRLYEKGVRNSAYLPNFKYLDIPAEIHQAPSHELGEPFRFCTFSRVMEQKGITDAAAVVEQLCAQGMACNLDVYGPVDDGYKQEFERILEGSSHVEYRGCVAPEESVPCIAGYDALLFPTKWKPEGIPGTIIDALSAGIPIIASKWQYYDEMLEDGITGFGYSMDDSSQLRECMRRLMSLSDEDRASIKYGCRERARCYSPDVVGSQIIQVMERGL